MFFLLLLFFLLISAVLRVFKYSHLHYFPLLWQGFVLLHPATTLCFFQSTKLLVDILYLKDGKKSRTTLIFFYSLCGWFLKHVWDVPLFLFLPIPRHSPGNKPCPRIPAGQCRWWSSPLGPARSRPPDRWTAWSAPSSTASPGRLLYAYDLSLNRQKRDWHRFKLICSTDMVMFPELRSPPPFIALNWTYSGWWDDKLTLFWDGLILHFRLPDYTKTRQSIRLIGNFRSEWYTNKKLIEKLSMEWKVNCKIRRRNAEKVSYVT